jgi:hypothetical protein
MPAQRLLTRFRQARNLGPAFHDRHPEQSDESALCVEHDDMIALDLSARCDHRLSAYSGVLKPHQICFASHLHFPNTSSANPDFLLRGTYQRQRAAFSKGKPHEVPQRHQLRQEIRGTGIFLFAWHSPKATCAAFSKGRPHEVPQRHQLRQEIRGTGIFLFAWHSPKATCAAFSKGKPHEVPKRHQLR